MPRTDTPLTILHILDHSLPLHSGYTFRSQNILLSQKARGWNAIALTSPKQEQNTKNGDVIDEQIGGIRFLRTGRINSSVPLPYNLCLMKALFQKLSQVIEQETPDVLHAHSPILNALPAIWAGRKHNIPVVYEIRAFWEDAAVNHGTYQQDSLKYKLVSALETYACKRVSMIVAICDGIKADLVKRGIATSKICLVPNAVDTAAFKPQTPALQFAEKWGLDGKEVIGFIGSFYDYEGIDLLVKATHSLRDRRPELRLLLVGGGTMDAALRTQVENLGLADRVIFTGRIPHSEVPDAYSIVDILVYPRRAMRLTDLVTPLKPLEAMAMQKSCVASDVRGHRELISHNETGVLFAAGDSNALANAISTLLDDEKRRHDIGKRGREWVMSERSWMKTTEAYVDIYDRILSASTSVDQ